MFDCAYCQVSHERVSQMVNCMKGHIACLVQENANEMLKWEPINMNAKEWEDFLEDHRN